jgi:N-acetyl-gamma-glutamyl-phosphate reductase
MIKVGIIGAAGYTAGELFRLLVNHPEAEIIFANSNSNAGNPVSDVHQGLLGDIDLKFTNELPFDQVDVIFLCMGHGFSEAFFKDNDVPEDLKVIDLGNDFRLNGDHGFTYGLPELNFKGIIKAKRIANPGCFATAIQLGLLPLAANLLLNSEIHVNAITGSTGAGQKPTQYSHFSWRNNNVSVYKAFDHQHIPEIRRSLQQLQSSFNQEINFIPVRGDFARGILAMIYVESSLEIEEAKRIYTDFYAKHQMFTFVTDKNPDLKDVVNTNKAVVHLEKHGNKLLIITAIDNLVKGASGQAIHNMNLMFDLAQGVGLGMKASAF